VSTAVPHVNQRIVIVCFRHFEREGLPNIPIVAKNSFGTVITNGPVEGVFWHVVLKFVVLVKTDRAQ